MNNELYSYDTYLGYDIFIEEDHGVYYGSIYKNKELLKSCVRVDTAEGCLTKCMYLIDVWEGE